MSAPCVLKQRPCESWAEERDEAAIARLVMLFDLHLGIVRRVKDDEGDLLLVLIQWQEEAYDAP